MPSTAADAVNGAPNAKRPSPAAVLSNRPGAPIAPTEPTGDGTSWVSRVHVHRVDVHFGDCDPAGIVFFPNFSRWMDESSLAFFMACGVPPWRELVKTRGILGTPLLEIHTRFLKTATYGESLEVHTTVESWAAKTFRHRHVIQRGDDVLCEGTEVRAFVVRDPRDPDRIKAIPVPPDIQALCRAPTGG